jgi:hypothetical protein
MAARMKEITMHANGQTTVWGTHIDVNRARDAKSWYQQIRDQWTAYKAARHDAKLATLNARVLDHHGVLPPWCINIKAGPVHATRVRPRTIRAGGGR